MKKLLSVIILTLAINFLAVAGAVGWLFGSGKLDHDRIQAIKQIIFPPPAADSPTSQPSADATTQPSSLKLEELLARAAGRSATEQVEFIQNAFDAQLALVDQRQRELADLQAQVDLARTQMVADRTALDTQKKALDAREQESVRLASDQGFQDSLLLYNAMPSKQVKTVFMGLDDQTVVHYLQAMQPRIASKIIKEFKTPEETQRIQTLLERMRLAEASIKE